MKKAIIAFSLLIVFYTPNAGAAPLGIGVSGGMLIPIAQEDQGTGALLAIKLRARFSGSVAIEPNISFGKFGEADIAEVGVRDGSSLKYYGVDLTLGGGLGSAGIKPYLLLGGAVYNIKRDGDETVNKSGWSIGAGVAASIIPMLDVDVRGRVNIVSSDGSASKKSASITGGLVYYLGGY